MANKGSITRLKSVETLKNAVDSLLVGNRLSLQQEEFLLSSAILLIKDFERDRTSLQGLEFAYWIILSYSLETKDYEPLYDFAVFFGLYPICDAIALIDDAGSLLNGFTTELIRRSYRKRGHIETIEQFNGAKAFDETYESDVAYLAPTSFGKSELVLSRIAASDAKDKVCIVVPTKSLLNQTAKAVKENISGKRLITHDEMYCGEKKFVAVLTQERALRLLSANEGLSFDELYIDEAHHLYDSTGRAILLTRLIRLVRRRNESASLFYLSPVIAEVSHLSSLSNSEIAEIRVRFNMKEPRYRLFLRTGKLQAFNRFFGEYLDLCSYADIWKCITYESADKNLIFVNSPKKIQKVARELASMLPLIPIDSDLDGVIKMLSMHVHADYDEIECIKHGVLYLHGQMLDSVKDYLEHKYNTLDSLRYVVANTVVLEGVNLPIDAIFILSSKNLGKRNLVNLIGRASRLNRVFGESPNLLGLMPKVTFIDNDEYDRKGGNMKNALERLRSADFRDEVKNPIIKKCEGVVLDDKENVVVEIETYVEEEHNEELAVFKAELFRLGFHEVYNIGDEFAKVIFSRIKQGNVKGLDLVDLLYEVFISGFEEEIKSKEFLRFQHIEARNYYRVFLRQRCERPLSYRVLSTLRYFKEKAASSDSRMYVGRSFGESAPEEAPSFVAYVDLSKKDNSELVGLAIAKIQNEENLLKYTLTRFVELLHAHAVISEADYNLFVYGTDDIRKIDLCRAGLPIPLVNRLESDGQTGNIAKDEFGNLTANSILKEYIKTTDDFVGFEIKKYLI